MTRPIVQELVYKCLDPVRVARFWGELLQCPWGVGEGPAAAVQADGIWLLFTKVDRIDPPDHVSQLHLDIEVPDVLAAVAVAERLGARRISRDHLEKGGGGFVSMRDPEGNTFDLCAQPTGEWTKVLEGMVAAK